MDQLRVMFQGGGARVVVLLAAAEALEQIAVQRPYLKIVQSAGVSAGALAAAALVANEPVTDIKNRMIVSGRKFLHSQNKRLKEIRAARKLLSFTALRNFQRARTGRSLLSNKALGEFLRETFEDANAEKGLDFGNSRLTVFVSDLALGYSIAYDSHLADKSKSLVEALQQSVQLPFVFSTFKTGSTTDGGITGNLPIPYFGQENDSDAKILAFHFRPSGAPFEDMLSYAQSLLSSAMNASVREAISQVEALGGVACELEDFEIGTLDFDRALEYASNDAKFELMVTRLKARIESKLDSLFSSPAATKISQKRLHASTLFQIHESLLREYPYTKSNSVQTQIMASARLKMYRDAPKGDKLQMAWDYHSVSPSGVRAVHIGLPFGDYETPLLRIRARDVNKTDLKIHAELFSIPKEDGQISRRAIVFFDECVTPERCPITLTTSFEYPAFKEFSVNGFDGSRSRMQTQIPTKKTWILVTPPTLRLRYCELVEPSISEQAKLIGLDVLNDVSNWSHGQELQSGVAARMFDEYFEEDLIDNPIFSGWQVEDFKVGTTCGFFVVRDE